MNIIIVAENVSERYGGEAILPLHYFRILHARGHKVWLVTHARVREELKAVLPPELFDHVHFMADTWVHRLLFHLGRLLPHRINVMTLETLMFMLSGWTIRKYVIEAVKGKHIEIVHQPYPVSPKRPSMLFDLGAPVVIGPMNGGMTFPRQFNYLESSMEKYFTKWIRMTANVANMLIPGKRKASALIVANQRTKDALPACCCSNIYYRPENGVDMSLWESRMELNATSEIPTFVFMGRLVDWKNVGVLIEAMALIVPTTAARLVILGDGKDRHRLERMVDELELTGCIDFLGFLPQAECSRWLGQSIALLLPSLYECGGAVVLEAMAMKKPVIAVAWGGPLEYVNDHTGILIAPESRSSMIGGFSESMLSLIREPEVRTSMGEESHRRIKKCYDWNENIIAMEQIYQEVINKYNE